MQHTHRAHWGHARRGRPFLGVLVALVGVILLLDNLHVPGLELVRGQLWPLLFVAWGLSALLFGRGGERLIGVFAILGGGGAFANRVLGWHLGWHLVWPLALIVFGVRMVFRRPPFHRDLDQIRDGLAQARERQHAGHVAPAGATTAATGNATTPTGDATPEAGDRAARIREFAFLGGVDRNNTSQAFQGGEITAVLGGVQLDLRECRMAGPSAQVDMLSLMGGVSLRIPRDWCVVSEVTVMLGGLDDRTAAPVDAQAPRLVITGQAIMGGIEIKN